MRHSAGCRWLALFLLIFCAGCQLIEFGVAVDTAEWEEMPDGWRTVSRLGDPEYPINSIEFTPDGKRVITSNGGHESWTQEDGTHYQLRVAPPAQIRVWSLNDHNDWHDNLLNITHTPGSIFDRRAFLRSSDNTVIARTSVDKMDDGYGVWNLETGKLVQTIKEPAESGAYGAVTSNRDSIVWPLGEDRKSVV